MPKPGELVDTQDLKSCGHCDRVGSIPAPGTDYKWVDGEQILAYLFTHSVTQTHTSTETKSFHTSVNTHSISSFFFLIQHYPFFHPTLCQVRLSKDFR